MESLSAVVLGERERCRKFDSCFGKAENPSQGVMGSAEDCCRQRATQEWRISSVYTEDRAQMHVKRRLDSDGHPCSYSLCPFWLIWFRGLSSRWCLRFLGRDINCIEVENYVLLKILHKTKIYNL